MCIRDRIDVGMDAVVDDRLLPAAGRQVVIGDLSAVLTTFVAVSYTHLKGWVVAQILNSQGENARRRREYDRALAYYLSLIHI